MKYSFYMPQKLTKEYVKKIIFETFKDVPKGDGLGARECGANDDYIYGEEAKKFRDQDVEQHWWEYPKELIEKGVLDYCLTYNNNDGIKFHLPAVMTADVEGISGYTDFEISIFGTLCEPYTEIHRYHREYVAYMKSIDISKIIKQYNFNSAQIHAIALYLLYDMHMNNFHNQFFSSRDEIITGAKKDVERSHDPKNYTLTLEDAVAIVDEEHRIVRDWFKAGGVEVNNYVFEEADSEDRFLAKWNKNKAEILKDKLDLSIEELKKIIQDQNLTIHDVMWLASQLDNPDQQVKIYRTVMTLSIPSKDSGINIERASYLQTPNNASVLLFNKGDYKGALEVIEPFLEIYTRESVYWAFWGMCIG